MRRPATPAAIGAFALLAAAGGPAGAADAPDGLHRCASVAADAERLACYDALAGRPRTAAAASAPAAAHSAEPPPPPAARAESPETFGLSPAQQNRPAPEPIAAIAARVTGFGRSGAGRPTMALDNGQLWESDADDGLLKVGDRVTIRRASLGSFLLTTQQSRTHRVHRLH